MQAFFLCSFIAFTDRYETITRHRYATIYIVFFFVFYDQLVEDVSFLAIKMSKSVGATEKAV